MNEFPAKVFMIELNLEGSDEQSTERNERFLSIGINSPCRHKADTGEIILFRLEIVHAAGVEAERRVSMPPHAHEAPRSEEPRW